MTVTKTTTFNNSIPAQLKAQRHAVLDKMSTLGIFGYLAYRHSVLLLITTNVVTVTAWVMSTVQ